METNLQIKKEYRSLINKLNQANKKSNQPTNIYFFIDSSTAYHHKLFAAIDKNQKILLCEKRENSLWTFQNYEFQNLSEFIVYLVNSREPYDDLTTFLTFHIFQLPR